MWIFYHSIVGTQQAPMESFESTSPLMELLLFAGAAILIPFIVSYIVDRK